MNSPTLRKGKGLMNLPFYERKKPKHQSIHRSYFVEGMGKARSK